MSVPHHVPSPRVLLPLQHSLMTLPDGMLNSYHGIIWVCPNHWLSPRLHLQLPTQLLSPTPTEVMWCTASHPPSVPPFRVCACEPTKARVLKWQSHLSSYQGFFSFLLSNCTRQTRAPDGLEVWSHHFIRKSWRVCSPSVCQTAAFLVASRQSGRYSLHLRFDPVIKTL